MPAQYVKPYVKRGKNDAADAEAVPRGGQRGRPRRSRRDRVTRAAKPAMMLDRVRGWRNALRAHLAEFGIVAPIGRNGIDRLVGVIADPADDRLAGRSADTPRDAGLQSWAVAKEQILETDLATMASARSTELGRRLMEIPRGPS